MGLFNHRNPETSNKEIPCDYKISVKASNINKNWVICILAAIVITLIAIVCASSLFNSDKVAMIISFTATILSIVLSLLAIIYTYLGNIESSGNLSEIRSAVSEIKATEDAVKGLVSNIVINMSNSANNQTAPSNQFSKEISPAKTSNNIQVPKDNRPANNVENTVG